MKKNETMAVALRRAAGLALATGLVATAGGGAAQDADAYGAALWTALAEARLVGEDAIATRPYEGGDPHGALLEFLETTIPVEGRDTRVIVKRNLGPDATLEEAWANGREHLVAITVMAQREAGWAPDAGDWYWAKWDSAGVPEVLGRAEGCISCHSEAEGGDFIFSY